MHNLAAEEHETLHAVLADQARHREWGELWRTAIGGGMNAMLLWTQFPKLGWLAGGFAAVAAYGLWGLTDRLANELQSKNTNNANEVRLARGMGYLAGIGGWAAACYTVVAFMYSFLAGLSLPGR